MNWFKRRIRHPLEAVGLWFIMGLFGLLPIETASNLGAWICRTIGPRVRANQRALRHLRLAFPEKSEAERAQIAHDMWDNLGRVFAEYPHLKEIADPASGRIDARGLPLLEASLASDQPTVVLSAHMGNWEAIPLVANARDYGLAIIVRLPNNPLVHQQLDRMRGIWGGTRIPKGPESGRNIVSIMRKKGFLGALIDQKMNEGTDIPFFGQPAKTATAIAQLSLRFNAHIHPIRMERLGPARFRASCFPALPHPSSGDKEADRDQVLIEFNRLLEEWIRERPAEWFWLHRRWPTEIIDKFSQ